MTPHIYLQRNPADEEGSDAKSDSCRDWLFRAGYAAPRVWSDWQVHTQLDHLCEAVDGGTVQLVVVPSLSDLGADVFDAARVVKRLIDTGAMLISVQDGLDLRGRDAVSLGQIAAVAAFTRLPRVERAAGGSDVTKVPWIAPNEEHVALIDAHYALYGRGGPGTLAKLLGTSPLKAGRILAKVERERRVLDGLKAQGPAGEALAAVFREEAKP
jgi:hypothetical protein